ncbi:MAG: terpene cyclase/mutase family protein [Pirellulaceae bacterium]|nr:terpene cyclase/mutase family protein [Pirellulaceae bacterium]
MRFASVNGVRGYVAQALFCFLTKVSRIAPCAFAPRKKTVFSTRFRPDQPLACYSSGYRMCCQIVLLRLGIPFIHIPFILFTSTGLLTSSLILLAVLSPLFSTANASSPIPCPPLPLSSGTPLDSGQPRSDSLLESGIKFIEYAAANPGEVDKNILEHMTAGGKSTMALAIYKSGLRPKNNPVIEEAFLSCQELCLMTDEEIAEVADLYAIGMAITFLAEVKPVEGAAEVEKLLRILKSRQRAHGGFEGFGNFKIDNNDEGETYVTDAHSAQRQYSGSKDPAKLGHTPMTQYGILALWTAKRAGFEVDDQMMVDACNWLIQTQDPSGGWGYKGVDPGANHERIQQYGVSRFTSSAGAGSLYICADYFGFIKRPEVTQRSDLPLGMKKITTKTMLRQKPAFKEIDPVKLQKAINDANGWFDKSFASTNDVRNDKGGRRWTYSYFYSLERYQSFRELAEGKRATGTTWYTKGASYLADNQRKNGSWLGGRGVSIDSAFAILFLSRGMQQSLYLEGFGSGRLIGGRGLPTAVKINFPKDKTLPKTISTDEQIEIFLNSLKTGDGEIEKLIDQLKREFQLSQNKTIRKYQLTKLHELLYHDHFQIRRFVVNQLNGQRDYDNIPPLIYALGDPDQQVVEKARTGLRFISRKLEGFPLPRELSSKNGQEASPPLTAKEKKELQKMWRKWYQTFRLKTKP